ncbi:acyl carrier protein [Streptomyces sp. NPDC050617]|uniref:acyl carrier protein n=1 Tax=Streptomyces sp. NPDC050617 TaxID=3154628 RepID=UPI0034124EA2
MTSASPTGPTPPVNAEIFEHLRDILAGKLHIAPEHITVDATHEDIELDSLALVELSLVLEKELGVRVSDDELARTPTVAGIVHLIEERSASAHAGK